MSEKIEVTKYIYNIDGNFFNIYIFVNNDILDFYIERENCANLYYCVGINLKDRPDDINQFIENNLDSWIFLVMNETEED